MLVILDAVFLVAHFWDTVPHFLEQNDWFEIRDNNICGIGTDILSYLKFNERNLSFCSAWFVPHLYEFLYTSKKSVCKC